MIFTQFTQGVVVEELRWKRNKWMMENEENPKLEPDGTPKKLDQGDMVFENACLFMRDAIISREFTDAIKANDPGRILLVLKIFALSFRGNGRLKYAYEMLFFLHHVEHVWPEGARRIALNNMVLNPSGEEDSGVEGDLVQEHVNLLAKVKYKARGSNASWEWMFVVTPCTITLRELQNNIHSSLGSDMGTKHASAKLAEDIRSLMDSLSEHRVYEILPGRVTAEDDPPVLDVISVGMQQLQGPLDEYNKAFKRLQERRKLIPVTQEASPELTFADLGEPVALSAGAASEIPPLSPNSDSSTSSLPAFAELAGDLPELNGYTDTTADIIQEEFDHMLTELEDEASLPLLTERDVALDMDAMESDDESDWESDSDSSSDYE
ncbi:hypothetical protein DFP72DRAFT_147275 [Ephemerocybe angulata]|uniref:DUF6589 domain-containing protein n=1 Tax=Ephemerocybe angulata TaxID=980116 RepID=A0A8H6H9S9_9AGAR|nr:hypothetical protein DFP72DRAFT_147275 [Tulosesus angulatus]